MKPQRLGALTLLFAISIPAITPRIYASDEIQYFAYLRSLWFDRDLSFDNEYQYFHRRGVANSFRFQETFLEQTTETGRRINFATIGCALLWAPFYATADVLVRLAQRAGWSVTVDGLSPPYIAAVCYASAIYGFLAIVLSLLAARRLFTDGEVAAVSVWLGTPLLFYMYIAPPMSHACSAFAVAAFVLAWLVVRDRWSMWGTAGLGALAALMAMVREQDVLYAVGPALDFLWTTIRGRREGSGKERTIWIRQRCTSAIVGLLAFIIAYSPQAAAYLVINGRLGPSDLVTRKMDWTSPHVLDVLLSLEHGLFAWTPLVLPALVGLLLLAWGAARRETATWSHDDVRIAACLLVMVGLQFYIAGSIESWTVAGAFGQRRLVGMTVLLIIGLSVLFGSIRNTRGRHVLGLIMLLCVWWNLGLTAQFGSGLMNRQRLELSRNAYNNFVVLPRSLPRLAYRYLVDRESFYRPKR